MFVCLIIILLMVGIGSEIFKFLVRNMIIFYMFVYIYYINY